jgi:hypothetical protein
MSFSKNGIIRGPLLSGVCFGISIGVPLIYDIFDFVVHFYGSLLVLCRNFVIYNKYICSKFFFLLTLAFLKKTN